jgi:hypothetical protein
MEEDDIDGIPTLKCWRNGCGQQLLEFQQEAPRIWVPRSELENTEAKVVSSPSQEL